VFLKNEKEKRGMKNTIGLGLLRLFLLVVIMSPFMMCKSADNIEIEAGTQGNSAAISGKTETTIRNVTKETVYYTVTKIGSPDSPEERALEVGAIDRFPGTYEIEVAFMQAGEIVTYSLDVGMPYSFRYNEIDLLELYEGSHGRSDAEDLAPWVPTPMAVVDRMLEMAEVDAETVLYDLGCGDGRIVIEAAKRFGARGVGVDIDPVRIGESEKNAKEEGVEHLVEFILGDVMKIDFSRATVVTIYLLPESNELLRPLFEKQLRKGAFVVTHNYDIPGWEDNELDFDSVVTDDGEEHDIYLYRKK
jgi:SAM-dependent methyltransferase